MLLFHLYLSTKSKAAKSEQLTKWIEQLNKERHAPSKWSRGVYQPDLLERPWRNHLRDIIVESWSLPSREGGRVLRLPSQEGGAYVWLFSNKRIWEDVRSWPLLTSRCRSWGFPRISGLALRKDETVKHLSVIYSSQWINDGIHRIANGSSRLIALICEIIA